jgi:hypothetical protein
MRESASSMLTKSYSPTENVYYYGRYGWRRPYYGYGYYGWGRPYYRRWRY